MLATRPEILISFGTNRSGSFYVDFLVAAIARLHCISTVQYLHTVGFRRLAAKSRVHGWMVRKFFEWASITVCLSEMIADDVSDYVAPGSVRVVRNAVEPVGENRTEPDLARFVFLANMIPEKGALDVVRVAERAEAEGWDARFELYGFEADAAYQAMLLREMDGLDNIAYLGPVTDQEQKGRVLAGATALLYPSRYPFEAQPLAIIEAMSVGVPVLAYATGAIPDLVVAGVSGEVCRTVDELYERTRALSADRDYGRRLSNGARGIYRERHTPERLQESWDVILREVRGS